MRIEDHASAGDGSRPSSGTKSEPEGAVAIPAGNAVPVESQRHARCMHACVVGGTRMVGGCRGTTPEHIAVVAAKLAR